MHVHAWKKYLPVIRILLKRAVTAEQVFSLDRIDFERMAKSHKPLCSFSLELNKGRVSPLGPPVTGKNLVDLLMDDPVSRDIIRHNHFAISLNSKFNLMIKNLSPVETAPAPVEDPASDEEPVTEPQENEEKEIKE
jgi:hypothetical protein